MFVGQLGTALIVPRMLEMIRRGIEKNNTVSPLYKCLIHTLNVE